MFFLDLVLDFPGGTSGKEPQGRGFDSRASHGQRNLAGYHHSVTKQA